MRRCVLVFVTVLLLAARAGADKVDDAIQAGMRRHPIPGLALEIITNGQVAKRAGYGMANLEWQTPVTPGTVFEIGSVTKQFTAAAILLLAQDGKLSLDDRLAQYLKGTPPSWKDITLRQLLTHTSGLRNYTTLSGFDLSQHLTQAQFIKRLGAVPLDFRPGEKWSYCNSGFSLLGYVIENVSGTNYWQFMRDRIFSPLGMSDTANRDPRQIIPFRAAGYETNKNGQYINRESELTGIFSAGAMVSTVDDLAKWDGALDSQKLLSAASEKEMWTPVKLNDGKTREYGLGWYLDPLQGHENIGHSGTTSGFSASNQRFPRDGLTVIVLTNSGEEGIATKVAKEIALLYLEK